jgi:hypothetical protein
VQWSINANIKSELWFVFIKFLNDKFIWLLENSIYFRTFHLIWSGLKTFMLDGNLPYYQHYSLFSVFITFKTGSFFVHFCPYFFPSLGTSVLGSLWFLSAVSKILTIHLIQILILPFTTWESMLQNT